MARDDTPLDQPTFDRVLEEELGKGTERRVAEGRWPRSARPDAPADRLRAGARLVRREDLLKQCH